MASDPKAVQALFRAVMGLPADVQATLLARACGDDAELRQAVEALLREEKSSKDSDGAQSPTRDSERGSNRTPDAHSPSAESTRGASTALADPVGTRIGQYKLLQRIGEGGMGVVYMAEQERPVRRRVAFKIIKPGMDTAQVVARFEAERQALALMDHQNIAKVLDAGATEHGRPYFVMELVHGVPITQYCDENHLTPRERLELFVPICRAIQHAHQKGIIHRDLKPSNLLVTLYDGKPVPKIIDFGVAKATEQRLTERTMFTQYGAVVGTFEYMAPEQAEMSGLGVDTRSDVYSLGVLLYELLTGTTPLSRKRLRSVAYTEAVRIIREEEPPRPSARLSTTEELAAIAAKRKIEPARLARLVRGELDWIVMKCLEKDRTRRYETANGLARDVERYLNDEPVEACPPSAAYRLRKVLRKHRGPVLAAAAVLACLLAGLGTVLAVQTVANRELKSKNVELAIAHEDERHANQELQKANERERQRFDLAMEAIKRFRTVVSEDAVLGGTQLQIQGMRDAPLGDARFQGLRNKLLGGAAESYRKLADALKGQNDRSSRAALGRAYYELGELTGNIGSKEDALAIHRRGLALRVALAEEPDTGLSERADLGLSYQAIGNLLRQLGGGREEEAITEHAKGRTLLEEVARARPDDVQAQRNLHTSLTAIAGALQARYRYAEGQRVLEEAIAMLEILRKAHPEEYSLTGDEGYDYVGIAFSMTSLNRLPEARVAYEQALRLLEPVATSHPNDVLAQFRLGACYQIYAGFLQRSKNPVDAASYYERSRAILETLVQTQPTMTDYQSRLLNICMALGDAYLTRGQYDKAAEAYGRERQLAESLVRLIPTGADYHIDLARALKRSGDLSRVRGKLSDAATDYHRAIAILEGLPDEKPAMAFYNLACYHVALGNLAGKPGSGLSSADATAEADRAVELLRLALAGRFGNLVLMKTDSDLNPLRNRPDFQKLLAELESRTRQATEVGKR
jgi:serine/threonine protein kinase/TPR repeat protein